MCSYDHWFSNKAYLSAITVTNISRTFAHKMAAKINVHRYQTKINTSLTPYVLMHFSLQSSCAFAQKCFRVEVELLSWYSENGSYTRDVGPLPNKYRSATARLRCTSWIIYNLSLFVWIIHKLLWRWQDYYAFVSVSFALVNRLYSLGDPHSFVKRSQYLIKKLQLGLWIEVEVSNSWEFPRYPRISWDSYGNENK